MEIRHHLDGSVLRIIFPPSEGSTWSERQRQFLEDARRPEAVYLNPKRCEDVLRASARYEGENRFVGFNLPIHVLRPEDTTLYPLWRQHPHLRYLIAYMEGDHETMEHEERHARYYIDAAYRHSVQDQWRRLPFKQRQQVEKKLKGMKYIPSVWIDEFQAYEMLDN